LDLHGNSKRKEYIPGGGKDENVFDIQMGVSINIFIKTNTKKDRTLADVFHADVYGKRETKYSLLLENTLSTIKWNKIVPSKPFYFFLPKDFIHQDDYNKGFSLKDLFLVTSPGIKTERDNITIHFTEQSLENVLSLFCKLESVEIKSHFDLGNDSRDWKIAWAKQDLLDNRNSGKTILMQYRPFDYRYTYYTGKSKGFIGTPGHKVVKHFLGTENIGLVFLRNMPSFEKWSGIFITDKPVEFGIGGSFPGNTAPIAPLYLYPDKSSLDKNEKRHPNFNMEIVDSIAAKTGLIFTTEKQDDENTFAPIDLLDYIYAVLYSNKYRTKYREFLKIDFPRVPYPENAEQFQKLASIGSLLRSLHLMENVSPVMDVANFPVAGTNEAETINYNYQEKSVCINKQQYFDNISLETWNYYIGGYRPAEKWLKDRKGRVLSFDDIEHYQKIIAVLKMTIELQAQIDEVVGNEIL
jgi:predicted helicase